MSWYFLDEKSQNKPIIHAVTPRVASTSQRRLYEQLGYPRLEEEEAKQLAKKRVPVHGVIREPFQRVVSAYRRHKPGFVKDPFMDYVAERYSWDRHVMPQTVIHTREGVPVTEWRLFEDLVSQRKFPHHNATPKEHLEKHVIRTSPEFMEWFKEVYAEDYEVYNTLLETLRESA